MPRDFMPILRHPDFRLPWALIAPHEAQARKNHGQTLERLAQRGGLGFCEAAAIMEDRAWSRIVWLQGGRRTDDPARAYLEALIAKVLLFDYRHALQCGDGDKAQKAHDALLMLAESNAGVAVAAKTGDETGNSDGK